ncbi:hypothetical protein JAAARDRAFT_78829 [Jaapia argillacea MUCL 33604]|uniref:Uncharacterized protein n=1 Tax=Jaapia argillacea MUCL 33604 TaxID=933084 RepID=A0A067PSK7_9AGAM|nr:hypothetical protein JAAARDRAFT_78829 [Jaapia argillacea MUCL 33604]
MVIPSSIFLSFTLLWAVALASQVPLSPPVKFYSPSTNLTSANLIFNTLASLLLQLPNTLHPNGHTIVPAVVSVNTLLYHARTDALLPPNPEWLAFDPEMSYSIMAMRPWGNVHMLTYVAKRDLRVMVFDGMSAQLGGTGPLDTQEVLVAREGGVVGGRGWFDDYTRADRLCEWAQGKGVEGFIRMNAGFELLWCNFDIGVDLVSHLNITAPDSPPPTNRTYPPPAEYGYGPGRRGPRTGADDPPPPPRRRPTDGPPRRYPNFPAPSPFTMSSNFEWLRIATHRFEAPQRHVRLIPSGLVTFYDPQFTSLLRVRDGARMSQHRIWMNISTEDANRAVDLVEEVLKRDDLWVRSGPDWTSIAREIVERWGDRLAQLRDLFIGEGEGHEPRRTLTQTLENVRLLAYTLLNPYLDTRLLPNSSTSDPSIWLPPTLERCISSRTLFIPDAILTPQDRLLRTSIETVLSRLCGFAGKLLAESLGPSFDDEEKRDYLTAWNRTLDETWNGWIGLSGFDVKKCVIGTAFAPFLFGQYSSSGLAGRMGNPDASGLRSSLDHDGDPFRLPLNWNLTLNPGVTKGTLLVSSAVRFSSFPTPRRPIHSISFLP